MDTQVQIPVEEQEEIDLKNLTKEQLVVLFMQGRISRRQYLRLLETSTKCIENRIDITNLSKLLIR